MKITGRHYRTEQAICIHVANDRIAAIDETDDNHAALPWIAPAFLDLQVNGFGGQDFTDPALTVDHVARITKAVESLGCGGYCPTVTTQSFDVLSHALRTIAQATGENEQIARRVIGIHLEGPYISREEGPRGAHPTEHCRAPDWNEFQRLQEAADGAITILTLSPEYDESAEFIQRVAHSGVTVAIGHTAADSRQITAAVDAGARFSTHLGNGAHSQIRRHPNYIWDQLAEDLLWASLIVDGHHLPAAVVKSFVRAKSAQRCLLVSDITGMAGMPPGEYRGTSLGDVDILEDGRIVVAALPQYLAGASLPIAVGVNNVLRFADVELPTAIDMASLRPAELLGIEDRGRIEVGARADLISFDYNADDSTQPFKLRETIRA